LAELPRIEREDDGTRAAIEAKFREAKQTYTLHTIIMKLNEMSARAIMLVSFVMKLIKKARDRARFFVIL
jgi:hypothetical protein